jgi:hypothetical protein
MRIAAAVFLIVTAVMLGGCKFSQEKIEAMKAECESVRTRENMYVMFDGFDDVKLDEVEVRQMRNGLVVDTFYFKPIVTPLNDGSGQRIDALIERAFNLDDNYVFIVAGEQFIVSNMKMGLVPQFTMLSEGYGCDLVSMFVNGKEKEHLDLVKAGSYWDFDSK